MVVPGTLEAAPVTQLVPSLQHQLVRDTPAIPSLLPVPYAGQLQTLCTGQSPYRFFPRLSRGSLAPSNIRDVIYGTSSMLGLCHVLKKSSWICSLPGTVFSHHCPSHHLILSGLVSFLCFLSPCPVPLGSRMSAS